MSFWSDLQDATSSEYAVGREASHRAMMEARESAGKSPEAPRARNLLGAWRTPQALKAAFNLELDPDYEKGRAIADVPFDVSTPGKRVGTVLGSVAADLTQDAARGLYWLLNAPQATADIISEEVIARARPDLYDLGKPQPTKKLDASGSPIMRRKPKYGGPGAIQAMSIPAGIAINTGLGLMTPFGGAEGYKAALPSEEDPSKTSNVLGEVGLKYIMGRTGNLLPYDEFREVRPDVSPDEYGRYKAFKYEKPLLDVNPFDDGQVGIGAGFLKATDEGIHGPEIQMLGRSLPVTTGVVPFATAVAGAALGGKYGGAKPVRRGFYGGMAGLAAGQIVGNIIETERRRRNTVENELDGTLR